MDKSIQLVDPVIEVIFRFWVIAQLSMTLRETIRTVHGSRYVYKSKVEGEN